ncbi:hypothetical protein COU14_00680 [Candidatus Kaiserbacteria bacterium CG10_big_fil_rev_8_21_14_0_10_44_10]|uniref:Uncharacterized protein n=1 Tax=Candidatus Kaiserbacteria bacterium CG10_big_fil_rev_8_21_14_0_10_44_10 TaxID=1974606 RepID=A0A2H0UKA0_9BACT|nr:MAG: hypothetical protein COU14_00680 [Candidatus Kaiserbacteria bacterium CG10_big_fil_rev_8_21_14_0_10_44_10]
MVLEVGTKVWLNLVNLQNFGALSSTATWIQRRSIQDDCLGVIMLMSHTNASTYVDRTVSKRAPQLYAVGAFSYHVLREASPPL